MTEMTNPIDGEIRLEPMRKLDVPRVLELEHICFSAPWDAEAYYGELTNPHAYYMVARLDGEIIGFAGMWAVGHDAHVVTLAVEPEYRRHGLGRRQMDALLAECRTRGVTRVTLEVRLSNLPAQGLYKSLGFRTVARRRGYYPDNGEDALVMALEMVG